MSEIINIIQTAVKTTNQPDQTLNVKKQSSPDTSDVMRFENALDQNHLTGNESMAKTSAETNIQQQAGTVNETIGDMILNNMHKVSKQRSANQDRIKGILTDCKEQTMSFSDIMSVQYELLQMGVQQDLTSKTADKFSQSVQTLFRTQ